MTERELDVEIAKKIFKCEVEFVNQKHGWRIDYRAKDNALNDPILAMGMVDGYRLKKFSTNLDNAMDAVHKLFPDDTDFALTIQKEVNEGFSGYHVYFKGTRVQSEKGLAYTICLAALAEQNFRDNPPPKEEDLYLGKSIYLRKDGDEEFIGIHGTYMRNPEDLTDDEGHMLMEAWINIYRADKSYKYSASRVFGPIEEAAEEYKKEGWVEVPDFEPVKK